MSREVALLCSQELSLRESQFSNSHTVLSIASFIKHSITLLIKRVSHDYFQKKKYHVAHFHSQSIHRCPLPLLSPGKQRNYCVLTIDCLTFCTLAQIEQLFYDDYYAKLFNINLMRYSRDFKFLLTFRKFA